MKIVIRCDAYPRLGIGHLMRCLALAEGFRDAGWEVSLLTYCTSKGLLERIRAQGFELHELESLDDTAVALTAIKAESPDWVVLDGYHFDTGFQHDIKGLGPKVLVFDDYHHLDSYECDIIVNQNLGAQSINYRAADNTCVLAGSYYVVLRKDFLDYGERDKRQIPPQGTKLLVTLGGADPDNLTVKVLKGLGHIKRVLHVRVVVGAANPRLEEIKEFARSLHHKVDVLYDVPDMQRLMFWADIALSAGGTTSWEIAYMGLPAIFTVIADNQQMGVDALSEAGYPSLGSIHDALPEDIAQAVEGLLSDSEKRQELSDLGKARVDGKGIERIVSAMGGGSAVRLRRNFDFEDVRLVNFLNLSYSDKLLVLSHRNSQEVRRWMVTDEPIGQAEHLAFIDRLADRDTDFYWLVRIGGEPAAVVSLNHCDFHQGTAHIGIYNLIKGAGRKALGSLMHLWMSVMGMDSLVSRYMEGNEKARALYEEMGFKGEQGQSDDIVRNGITVRFVIMRTGAAGQS